MEAMSIIRELMVINKSAIIHFNTNLIQPIDNNTCSTCNLGWNKKKLYES